MSGSPINVLLVEDNPGDARLLREALAEAYNAEFRLVHVERLADALKSLAEQEWHVVLLDLSLPDGQGLDTVMRVHAAAPGVPVVVLTGLSDEALAVKAVREGAQDYLVKGEMDSRLLRRAIRYAIERKRAQEEKRQLQEELAQAQKMQAVGTLAGGIAHEFNNINAAIIGYVDLILQTEELPDTARKNLGVVRRSAVRGADLTRSLLAFSRKDVRERKPVDLKGVVDEVLRLTEKEFTSEGIEVTVGHSTKVSRVMGDGGLLTHVVMNLVINARHAMLKSPVKRLTVETGQEKERPLVRVRDTGCGIPKEDLSRVFEPFFTTKGSLASGGIYDGKAHGTGLGLSVCHSIVKGHEGEIKVRSQVGKGTTFTVYLPAARNRKTTRRVVEEGAKESVRSILVVDDEEAITDLLVEILDHHGYAADGFTDPREALTALSQRRYFLAFVDLQMPQMNGEEFIRRINRLVPEERPLKVILTGRLAELHEDHPEPDVFATLLKPFSSQQVLEIAKNGLSARAAATGNAWSGAR